MCIDPITIVTVVGGGVATAYYVWRKQADKTSKLKRDLIYLKRNRGEWR